MNENGNGKKSCLEGYVITLMGILFVIGSIMLPDNPVKMEGWIGFIAQARFFPLMTGLLITVLGMKLTLFMKKQEPGAAVFQYDIKKEELKQLFIVIAIICLYLLAISMTGFLIPTIVYFFVILFYLNHKTMKPLPIAGTSIAFIIVSYYLVPMMLKIQLP